MSSRRATVGSAVRARPRSKVQGPRSKIQGPRSKVIGVSLGFVAFLPVLGILLWTWGCSAAERRTDAPSRGSIPSSASSSFEEAPEDPSYDPTRAFLPLAQISLPAAPTGQATSAPSATHPSGRESSPLSARGTRYLRQAQELITDQRYTEATQALEKALRSDPASCEIHRTLALAAFGAGNQERARSHAVEALQLDADDPVSHYVLGRTALERRDCVEAIAHFRTGLRCASLETAAGYDALTEFYLAKALEAEGYLTAAIEAYKAYDHHAGLFQMLAPPKVNQDLSTLLRLGRRSAVEPIAAICERLGRYAEAAEAWGLLFVAEEAPAVDVATGALAVPELPDAATRLRYAHLLAAAGRYEDALQQCRRADSAEPQASAHAVIALLANIRERMHAPQRVLDDVEAIVRRRPDDREWLLEYVDLLIRFGDRDRAEQSLTEYVAAHPDATDVAWTLCDHHIRADRGLDAMELAARIVAGNPREHARALTRLDALSSDEGGVARIFTDNRLESPAGRYLLGALALRTGRTQLGVTLLRRVLETAPDFTPARSALAEQLLAEYRWREVVDLLEPVDRPDAGLEWALGEAYAGLDEDERAAGRFSAAVRVNRADTRSMYALGQLYERTDKPLRARRQYEALLEVNPLHEKAREALFGLYVASRLFEAAQEQVRELRKLAASPNCIARCEVRARLARGVGKLDLCRDVLLEAMEKGGPDADSLAFVAYIDIERDSADSAEQVLSRALVLEPDHLVARELLVSVRWRQLRFDEAEEHLRTLLERYPNRQQWVRNLANVLMIEQDYAAVAELISSYLGRRQLGGSELRASQLLLLQALQAAERFEQQIATVQAWLREDESDRTLRAWLVAAHLAGGDVEAARALTRQWYLADPADARTAAAYRGVLIKAERFTAAEQLVLEALEDDPDNEGLQLALIGVLGDAGRFDEALELVENYLPAARRTRPFLAHKLDLYNQAGRYADVVALAGRMLQDDAVMGDLDPLNEAAVRRQLSGALIEALLADGRHDIARVKLTRWIEQAETLSDKFDYLKVLSLVQQQQGHRAAALESLDFAYLLNPTDVGINNDLGYTLADLGTRLDEAEHMVRFAVAREPTNSAYLDSLGWVLYRRGDFDGARRWLSRAAGAPDALEDPVIHDHLGDACWRVGDNAEAVEHWTEAVKLAEQLLREREQPVYRSVVESAGEKRLAAESGQPPPIAGVVTEPPVAQDENEGVEPHSTAGDRPAVGDE